MYRACFFGVVQTFDRYGNDAKVSSKLTLFFVRNLLIKTTELILDKPTLANLLAKILYLPISEHPVILRHRHDDQVCALPDLGIEQECKCTLLMLIIRFHFLFDGQPDRESLESFLIHLFIDSKFKIHLAIEFLRMNRFMYSYTIVGKGPEEILKNKFHCSGMKSIEYQLYNDEENCNRAFREGGYAKTLEAMVFLTKVSVDNGGEVTPQSFVYNILNSFGEFFKSGKILCQFYSNPTLTSTFFSIFEYIEANRFEFIPDMNFSGMDTFLTYVTGICKPMMYNMENFIYKVYYHAKHLYEQPDEVWKPALFNIFPVLKNMIMRLNKHQFNQDFSVCSAVYVECAIERIFIMMVTKYCSMSSK